MKRIAYRDFESILLSSDNGRRTGGTKKRPVNKPENKKMKNKLVAYAALPVIVLGLAGAGIASAHGTMGGFGLGRFGDNLTPDQVATNHQTMFQNEANFLGISVDDVKNGWAQGKTLQQIAQDHGITREQLQQKMKDAWTAAMKTQLQTLVTKGIITQAQADARLQFLESAANGAGKGRMGKGFHRGFGF